MIFDFLYFNLGVIVTSAYLLLALAGILRKLKKLPSRIDSLISFIFSFELSRKHAIAAGMLFVSVYAIYSSIGIQDEEGFADYTTSGLKNDVENFSASYLNQDRIFGFSRLVKHALLSASLQVFGNMRIVPFLASVAIVVLAGLVAKEISRKRFAGIVAMIILMQSSTFRLYDDSAAYDNFSTLFYIASIYALVRKWNWCLPPVLQVLSIFSKAITIVFVPFSMFFAYRSSPSRRNLALTLAGYSAILALSVAAVLLGAIEGVKPEVTQTTLSKISYAVPRDWQLDDPLVFTVLPPVIAGLFVLANRGVRQADAIMLLIAGMLWISFLLPALTNITDQPYRNVPLIAFFAIGAGMMFAMTDRPFPNGRQKYIHLAILALALPTVLLSLSPLLLPA
jgi:hypothetical protein